MPSAHELDEQERTLRFARLLQALPWAHPGFMFGLAAGLRSWGTTGDVHAAAWWAGTIALAVYGLGLAVSIVAWGAGKLIAWATNTTQDKADLELGRETRRLRARVEQAVRT